MSYPNNAAAQFFFRIHKIPPQLREAPSSKDAMSRATPLSNYRRFVQYESRQRIREVRVFEELRPPSLHAWMKECGTSMLEEMIKAHEERG